MHIKFQSYIITISIVSLSSIPHNLIASNCSLVPSFEFLSNSHPKLLTVQSANSIFEELEIYFNTQSLTIHY